MAQWRVYTPDGNAGPTVTSDGISPDGHGNIMFLDAISNGKTEVVAVLLQSGAVAKKEAD